MQTSTRTRFVRDIVRTGPYGLVHNQSRRLRLNAIPPLFRAELLANLQKETVLRSSQSLVTDKTEINKCLRSTPKREK